MSDLRLTFNCGTLILCGDKTPDQDWVLWFEDADGNRLALESAFFRVYGYYRGKKFEDAYRQMWKGYDADAHELKMTDRDRDSFTCHLASIQVKMDMLCPCRDENCVACAPIVAKRMAHGESLRWSTLF